MDATIEGNGKDPEVEAISVVFAALRDLDAPAQERVLDYVIGRLGLKPRPRHAATDLTEPLEEPEITSADRVSSVTNEPDELQTEDGNEGLEGVNDVGRKWMRRNGLTTNQVSALFSLGLDEIDLVADKVPGDNLKQRLRSVLLLKAIASYLGSGAARVDHKKLKETASHYDADAGGNMATYIREMGAELSGSATSGYSLTTRGLTAAAKLIKDMTNTSADKGS